MRTLEQPLPDLEAAGIRLRTDGTIDDLFMGSSREDFERDAHLPLLLARGSEVEEEAYDDTEAGGRPTPVSGRGTERVVEGERRRGRSAVALVLFLLGVGCSGATPTAQESHRRSAHEAIADSSGHAASAQTHDAMDRDSVIRSVLDVPCSALPFDLSPIVPRTAEGIRCRAQSFFEYDVDRDGSPEVVANYRAVGDLMDEDGRVYEHIDHQFTLVCRLDPDVRPGATLRVVGDFDTAFWLSESLASPAALEGDRIVGEFLSCFDCGCDRIRTSVVRRDDEYVLDEEHAVRLESAPECDGP